MVDKRFKYILYILMIISLFFSIKNKVSAETLTATKVGGWTDTWSSSTSVSWNTRTALDNNFTNKGEGQIYFSMSIEGKFKVYGITINSNNKYWACQYDSVVVYNDNTNQIQTLSVGCYVGGTNSNGLTEVLVYGESWNNSNVFRLSNQFTYTTMSNMQDYNTTLTNIRNDTLNISERSWEIKSSVSSIDSKLSTLITSMNTQNTSLVTQIQNQTQQQHQDSQNTQQKIEDVNNTIKDSSVDNQNAQNTFDSLNSNMASNGTISQLLLMPITLLQKILNAMSGSCTAINTGQILGADFILPCINISDIIGSTLWNVIDVICSGFMAFAIGKRFIKIFNQFTNLKEGGLESCYD